MTPLERLAQFVVETPASTVPAEARREMRRAFTNWLGCAIGGSLHDTVSTALAPMMILSGAAQSTVIGRGVRTDAATAAFVNCLSSSVDAFDDTDAVMMLHPTSPVASAAFAYAEHKALSGMELLHAVLLGVELEYRLCKMLSAAPAQLRPGFYLSGLTGVVGAAAAVGRLMQLDHTHMTWALAVAMTSAAGFQETLSTMCCPLVPSHAARNGLVAAYLASNGFTGSTHTLEAPRGYAAVFADLANLDAATEKLGERYELLSLTYKPYPCGIVIHPSIDACLALVKQESIRPEQIVRVELRVYRQALTLCGNQPSPADSLQAQVSIHHWVAAALLRGRAGSAEAREACIMDPAVKALRRLVVPVADPSVNRDEAWVTVHLSDGRRPHHHVTHCRGSIAQPLSDNEIEQKFRDYAGEVLSTDALNTVIAHCNQIDDVTNVSILAH